ncbi:unnamed protein product [Candida verbasci]|uniref:Uncharacterized protein n=1 Tax=Candida verbasci TaxID=1227364 RepID=A0A9W4XJ19_9ASCO|nr:unnamed protein product [Candida verbasci]
MSEIVDKVKSQTKQHQAKQFDSKVVNHIESYPLIQSIKSFLLSFQILNIVYSSYLLPLYNFINANLFSISPIYDILSYFDLLANNLLNVVDTYLISYPLNILSQINQKFVLPIDSKLIETNNKFLNPIEKDTKEDLFKIYKTLLAILYNVKDLVFENSNKIQKNLVDTYNSELKSTKQQNYLSKNLEASYNTGLKTIQVLNDDYFQPLKHQTQDYVDQFTSQTKQKTDEFINDAKSKVNPKLDEFKEKKDDLFNNGSSSSPVVSASA